MKSPLSQFTASGLRSLLRNNIRLLKIRHHQKPLLLYVVLATTLLISTLPFIRQGAYALLVNNIASGGGHTVFIMGLVAALLVVPEFIYNFEGFISRRNNLEMQHFYDIEYLKKKGGIDVARYEDAKFNDLLNTANERGIWPLINLSANFVTNIQNIVGVVVSSVILALYDWKLFALIGIALIPKLYVEIIYGKEVWGIFSAGASERRRFWDLRDHFYTVPKLTELKLFQNIGHFITLVGRILTDFNQRQFSNEYKRLRLSIGALCLSAMAYLYFGYSIVNASLAGTLTAGGLIFVMGAVIEFGNALSGFFLNIGRQYQENLFVDDILKIMDSVPVIKPVINPCTLDTSRPPTIEFKQVSFKYPNGEHPILQDVSFMIEPGQKIALVGINGAGKTTLIKLLCRFYDPTEGKILINGIDLREIDLEQWWSMLGVLFQDFAQYNFVVKEAIGLGRTSAPLEQGSVLRAAEMSESDEFISKWEKGYEQMIGKEFEGGINPSKGQIQKLALARVFFRNPHVMVLDEPTASVDAESEGKIFERFTALPKTVSAILISHRFSTVRRTDKIILLKDRHIEEMGSHAELMEKNGLYANLFHMQAEGYKD